MVRARKLWKGLSVFILAVGFLTGSLIQGELFVSKVAAAALPSHVTLTWTDDPRTTQTITWKTDTLTQDGQVQYWAVQPGKMEERRTLPAKVEQADSNWGTLTIHTVTLTGLEPGRRYAYRVGSAGGWSEPYQFATAPDRPQRLKFMIFGDSQSINYNIWHTTLQQAYRLNRDAAFFINMGDLVDVGQEYGQWNAWFNAAQGVLENIPCMPLVGNHETYSPSGKFAMPVLFTAQFKLPLNGPDGLKGQVYSFDYGDIHFVMLDTQSGEEGRFVPDMLERQKLWLEQDLAATRQPWKLVFLHRAPYNNKAAANGAAKTAFAPIIEKYHADLAFTAHDHVYAHTPPLFDGTPVDSPARGTIYVATGRSGSKTYSDSIAREWNNFFYNPQDEPNYLTVEKEGNVLTVKAFKQSGVLIDAWSVTKSKTTEIVR